MTVPRILLKTVTCYCTTPAPIVNAKYYIYVFLFALHKQGTISCIVAKKMNPPERIHLLSDYYINC